MEKRNINFKTIVNIVNNGDIKSKDETHFWVYLRIEDRDDNLICAAALEKQAIIILTVMIDWKLEADDEN